MALETGQLNIRREAVHNATNAALAFERLDAAIERIERLERRAGLLD